MNQINRYVSHSSEVVNRGIAIEHIVIHHNIQQGKNKRQLNAVLIWFQQISRFYIASHSIETKSLCSLVSNKSKTTRKKHQSQSICYPQAAAFINVVTMFVNGKSNLTDQIKYTHTLRVISYHSVHWYGTIISHESFIDEIVLWLPFFVCCHGTDIHEDLFLFVWYTTACYLLCMSSVSFTQSLIDLYYGIKSI